VGSLLRPPSGQLAVTAWAYWNRWVSMATHRGQGHGSSITLGKPPISVGRDRWGCTGSVHRRRRSLRARCVDMHWTRWPEGPDVAEVRFNPWDRGEHRCASVLPVGSHTWGL